MQRNLSVAVIAACPFPYPRGMPVRIQRSAACRNYSWDAGEKKTLALYDDVLLRNRK